MGLLWEGALRDFPAEVVAINPDDGTLCLCFADAAEISRIQNNPKHADVQKRATSTLQPDRPGARSRGSAAEDAAAIYDLGVMLAFGLCGLVRDRARGVQMWVRAAALGHASAQLGLRVHKDRVKPLCSFHLSPEVKEWWRLLPPSVLTNDRDVVPEEVIDSEMGGSLADAAAAPDPVSRAHAAADAVIGAFAATLRSMDPAMGPASHTGKPPLLPPGETAPPSGGGGDRGEAAGGDAKRPKLAAEAEAGGQAAGGQTGKLETADAQTRGDPGEAAAWHGFLCEHLSALDRSIAALPSTPRAAQLARIAELQAELGAVDGQLSEELTRAKSAQTEARWTANRILNATAKATAEETGHPPNPGGGH